MMIEKRFELAINPQGQCDIIDHVESKEKNAICIYNDLGVLPFSAAKALCNLMNELHEENQQLRELLNIGKTNAKDIIDVLNEQEKYKIKAIELEEENQALKKALDEADDLIKSHLNQHWNNQWENYCKNIGVDLE